MYRETAAGLDHPDCVLQSVSIQADLHETLARVSTTHQYINAGTANIEAVYAFPLSIDAVLLDMNLVVGNQTLTGQIFPKKTGRRPLQGCGRGWRSAGHAAKSLSWHLLPEHRQYPVGRGSHGVLYLWPVSVVAGS